MKIFKRVATLIIPILALIGCQSAPVKSTYTLEIDTNNFAKVAKNRTRPYAVAVSDFSTFYNTYNQEMLYSMSENEIESYSKSEWILPPHKILQANLINALVASNHFKDVIALPSPISTKYKIDGTVNSMRQFFKDNESYVELAITIRLINSSNQTIVFSNRYEGTEKATPLNAVGGVEAYNRLMNRLMADIIRDLTRY